ncbi:MAG: restriction endonuclease subunit S [Clostridia bacterium]|nr:restriction endonuclease subunit S [Clostridia bacterium]
MYRKVSEKNDLTYGKEDIISVANMYFKEDSYITDNEYLRTYNVFLLGDIAFEGNKSKDFKHGRFVENTIGNGIVSHVFDVFRPIMGEYDLLFWKYAINNERLMGKILVRATKASTMMTNLVADDFLGEYFLVPTYEEQKAIGQTLNEIDNLITLHQCKDFSKRGCCETLKFQKKHRTMTTTWEQRELWTITTWDKKFNEVEKEKQPRVIKYPYVLAEVFNKIEDETGDVRLLSTGTYIGYTTEEKAGDNLCEGEIVAIPWGGIPNIKYFKGKFVTADNRIAISNDENIIKTAFISCWLQSHISQLESFYRGASIKHPSMSDVLNMVITYPCTSEQAKIVSYLFKLDNLITLHQRG